jgi:hypothetical protein
MKHFPQIDANGYFIAAAPADESPREPGRYLMPAGAIEAPLPTPGPDQRARWDGAAWTYETVPPPRGDAPYPSWSYDETAQEWVAPEPRPDDAAVWDEGAQTWVPGDEILRREIDTERDRRLAAGAEITVDGYGPIPVQGRQSDMTILASLKDAADDALSEGDETLIQFRDRDNQMHSLTPAQMRQLVQRARAHAQAIYAAAWALKDAATIPSDYTSDEHWP